MIFLLLNDDDANVSNLVPSEVEQSDPDPIRAEPSASTDRASVLANTTPTRTSEADGAPPAPVAIDAPYREVSIDIGEVEIPAGCEQEYL